MTKINKIDWEEIYNDYRTGKYSNRAMGSKHGISEAAIRKRAKKEGWKKELISAYQEEVETQLIEIDSQEKQDGAQCEPYKSSQSGPKIKTDKDREKDRDVVKDAAKIGVEVVREHRKDIRTLKESAGKIGKIISGVLSSDEAERSVAVARFSELTSHTETVTDVLNKLTRIHSECIKLERTAFNLDKKEGKETSNTDLDERIKARMTKKKNAHR